MTTTIWLRDIGALVLQLALVIGTGAALSRLFRLADPRATLAYWRALLLVGLLLPLLQPWRVVTSPTLVAITTTSATIDVADVRQPVATSTPPTVAWPAGDIVLFVLVAGIAARGLWLLIGAFTLGRLRRTARRLEPLPAPMQHAFERVGGRAGAYLSDRITGPITFGLIRPVVLLPPSVLNLAPHVQEAIAYHELLHVQRRDWLHEVLEEVVRTLFWFHPAVWWLIGRIRLSREQVVDRAAIRLTESRDRYVEALLAVALTQSPVALAPAPLFLRRSLLKQRVTQILQETTMTTRRLIASLTVSAAALSLAAIGAVRSFPLEAREQPKMATNQPVQIARGGEHLLHASLPEYPRRAIEQRVEGDVLLDLTLDDHGEVSDARVVSGPEELRRAALESVLKWHYSPADSRSTSTQVALSFHIPPEGIAERNAEFGESVVRFKVKRDEGQSEDGRSPAQRAERLLEEVTAALADPNTPAEQREELEHKANEAKHMLEKIRAERDGEGVRAFEGTPRLVRIGTERVPRETVQALMSQVGISIGDPITEATAKRISETASTIDEHLRVSFRGDGKGGVVLMVLAP